MVCAGAGGPPQLMPADRDAEFRRPEPTIPRSRGTTATGSTPSRGAPPASANFAYGARLSEIVLLGAAALRTRKALDWGPRLDDRARASPRPIRSSASRTARAGSWARGGVNPGGIDRTRSLVVKSWRSTSAHSPARLSTAAWPQGHEPQDDLHTLLIVRTDAGARGLRELLHVGEARGRGDRLLWPLLRGQPGVEPERVTENAPAIDLLAGARRGRRARDQRHRHRALGPYGKCLLPARLAPARGNYRADDQAVRLDPLRRARAALTYARQRGRAGVQGDQARLAAVRPARPGVRRGSGADRPAHGSATTSS